MLINFISQLGTGQCGGCQCGRAIGPNRICSDNAPPPSREVSVSVCFKRGLKAGFAAGRRSLQRPRGQAQAQAPEQPPIPPVAPYIPGPPPELPRRPPPPRRAPRPAPRQVPSLEQLYRSTDFRASRRKVDFMKTLPITNPDFLPGGPRYLSSRQKRALGTDGLVAYLVSTGEYRE